MTTQDPNPIQRPILKRDHETILRLNNAALPAVNELTGESLSQLLRRSCWHQLVLSEDSPVAFLIALAPGSDYASPNYQWFAQRFDEFLYIDRVVVDPGMRRAGLAQRLYHGLHQSAAPRAPRLTCEVNLIPPNPGSLSFHQRLGFSEVGQQSTEGGLKRVTLLCREPAPFVSNGQPA